MKTKDLRLAHILKFLGFSILEVQRKGKVTTFVFSNKGLYKGKMIDSSFVNAQYWNNEGNNIVSTLKKSYDSLKELKNIIHAQD